MLNLIKKWLTPLNQENDKTVSDDLSVIWIHGANQSGLSFQYLRSFSLYIKLITICLHILEKAVKSTKTDMDDKLLEVVKKALTTREEVLPETAV